MFKKICLSSLLSVVFIASGILSVSLWSYAEDKKTSIEQLSEKSQAVQVKKININTATAEVLAQGLKGVGLSKAKAIVAWRTQYGKFKTIDQLTEVKGIGEGTVQKNKSNIKL